MNFQNHVQLGQLAAELNDLPGTVRPSPGYRKLAEIVRDGTIRTVISGGRHYVPRPDLPEIARVLGMLPGQADEPRRELQVAVAEHATA